MNKHAIVKLENPILRGNTEITEIELRRPNAGTLKGVTLTAVLEMDVNALTTVLPRITNPALTQRDVQNLDPADLVALGSEVASFLAPKSVVDKVKAEMGQEAPAPAQS